MSEAKKLNLRCDRGTSMTIGIEYLNNGAPTSIVGSIIVMAVKPDEWDESLDDSTALILKRTTIFSVVNPADMTLLTGAVDGDACWVESQNQCYMFDGTNWNTYASGNPHEGRFTITLTHDDTLIPVETYFHSIDIRRDAMTVIKIAKGNFSILSNTVNVI
jgi:hypothetical protein